MNFKYKCFLQRVFSTLPRGEQLNYVFQKYVTHTLPISDDCFIARVNQAYNHYLKYTKYAENRQKGIYYEFGAGWHLVSPIMMSLLGFRKLYCVDIRKLITAELIQDTVTKLSKLKSVMPFNYDLERVDAITNNNYLKILEKRFGIEYVAPLDARHTDFPSNSVDFISSNLTFEHIPKADVMPILLECHRLLKKGGIFSFTIDYQDHWSHFDKKISAYNFLQYSDGEWSKYNPSLNFQNRLRHRDYMDMIRRAGFMVLEEKPILPSEHDVDTLKKMKLESLFSSNYKIEELGVRAGEIVVKK